MRANNIDSSKCSDIVYFPAPYALSNVMKKTRKRIRQRQLKQRRVIKLKERDDDTKRIPDNSGIQTPK